MARTVIDAFEGEFRRYKTLAEKALAQLADGDLHKQLEHGNSVAVLCSHISGNLRSRFKDFLTTDGEKPWRDREAEFADRPLTRTEIVAQWEDGWTELTAALKALSDEQLNDSVAIRGVRLSVIEALSRSLAHVSYHVGQIVMLARSLLGDRWEFLSIPPGQTAAYNADPRGEKPPK